MQVSVESIGKLERRMQVQVPAERVSQEIAARLKNLSRTARLKGFRPGKAPLKVIRQQFGQQVHREVIGELLQSSFAEAVTEKQLSPAGNPRIEPQSIDEGQDLTLRRDLRGFPGSGAASRSESLEIERVTAEVTESDIDAMIERLRKQQMKFARRRPAPRPTATRSRSISWARSTASRSPAARARTSPSCSARAGCCRSSSRGWSAPRPARSATSAWIFPPITAPPNSPASTRFSAPTSRRSRSRRCRSSTRSSASRFGVTEGGVPKLREDVARQHAPRARAGLRNRNKAAVMEKLYQANPIDVPNALLESQVRDMQVEAMRRTGAKDVSQAPPREPLVEPARRRVALGLLFNDDHPPREDRARSARGRMRGWTKWWARTAMRRP